MIYSDDYILPKGYLKQLIANDLESLSEMIRVLVNEAMQIKRSKYLNTKTVERSRGC